MTETSTPALWLLLDDRASHRSQVFGVAQRLGWKFEVKEIRYNRLATLANVILGRHLWHLAAQSRTPIQAPWPDLVIAAGRRAAPVARYIKKRSHGKTRIVHLMWPDAAPASFDLIALPEHDVPGHKGANVLATFGAPHPVTVETLRSEARRWERQASRLPAPRIALLVGGSTRHAEYEDADFRTLAAYASAEAERLNGSLLVSTSPRTGEKGEMLVKSLLAVPHLFHRWQPGGDNPFIAFLGLADAIIVTGDSVSMCSEACATGKPVYIFIPPHLGTGKKTFRDALFAGAYAKPHTYPIRLDWQPAAMPDPAGQIAEAIRTRLFARKKE